MLGLLWKDLFLMRQAKRTYALMLGSYVVMGALGLFDLSVLMTVISVSLTMLPLSTFVYDERARWQRYVMALPLSPGQVVGARYLFALVMMLLALLLNCLASVALALRGSWSWGEHGPFLLGAASASLFVLSVMLPLNYKLGSERARPFLYVFVLLSMALTYLLMRLPRLAQQLGHIRDLNGGLAAALGAVFSLGLFVLSYRISVGIVSRQEF